MKGSEALGLTEEYYKIVIKMYREEVAELREIKDQYKQAKLLNSTLKSRNRKLEKRLIQQQQENLKLKIKVSSYELL